MPLESTMVCLDNSEWMRNGDYTPTRMEAQHDAANLVCGSKTQQNPENTVGILTMAGSSVEVLCSPTDDMGKILGASAGIKIGGKANLANGLQIAQLALKHRKNKNGGQRIVVFVGSPVDTDEKKLIKIAKQLKKSNIAVDLVSLGEEGNDEKLQNFVEAVNKNNNSHLVTIPRGVLPSDVLITSPVITGDDGSGGGGGGGGDMGGAGAFAEFGGVDPNLDPELALALRVSMEEARAEAEKKAAADQDAGKDKESSAKPATPPATKTSAAEMDNMEDEDAMLQQALMMSMAQEEAEAAGSDDSKRDSNKRASSSSSAASSDAGAQAAGFLDPNFVQGLLTGLPGVDINDPAIQEALAKAASDSKDDKDDDKKKKKKKDDKDK